MPAGKVAALSLLDTLMHATRVRTASKSDSATDLVHVSGSTDLRSGTADLTTTRLIENVRVPGLAPVQWWRRTTRPARCDPLFSRLPSDRVTPT